MSRFCALILILASLAAPSLASAESSALNLHFSTGLVVPPIGGALNVGFDWQFRRGFALDGTVGGMLLDDGGLHGLVDVSAGVRFRFLDSHRGYANEKGGDAAGNLFLVPRVGVKVGPDAGYFTADVEAGYEWSVVKPVQLGLFVRPGMGVGNQLIGYVVAGVSVSVGLGPEIVQDTDRDGVLDDVDACPGTPLGTTVDGRGCTVLPPKLELTGIRFKLDSAEIQPESADVLQAAARSLKDNPSARVEIGGHTDDLGTVERNQVLSEQRAQAVADWLTAQGVSASRLVVKGYGRGQPKVANDSDEHRAMNRRIEFRRLDP